MKKNIHKIRLTCKAVTMKVLPKNVLGGMKEIGKKESCNESSGVQ